MKDFKKTVRLGTVQLDATGATHLYCQIEFTNGKLSISGVEGPRSNGDALGGCGQIIMNDWDFVTYAEGWSASIVEKFREVWNEWHLNDMTPNCEHQVGPEWTSRDVFIYHYRLKPEICKEQRHLQDVTTAALRKGEAVQYTEAQVKLLELPYFMKNETGDCPLDYEAAPNNHSQIEKTGWLNESEHSAGFLSKACPVCGYKYGSKWLKREVPEDVLEFLVGLPNTDKTPAWV